MLFQLLKSYAGVELLSNQPHTPGEKGKTWHPTEGFEVEDAFNLNQTELLTRHPDEQRTRERSATRQPSRNE